MVTMPPIVCEIGVNHLGEATRARRMIDALANAGATHMTVQVVTDPLGITRDAATVESLRKVALSLDDVHGLLHHASACGLIAGATVLDDADVPGLVKAGARFFKILSSDIYRRPLRH